MPCFCSKKREIDLEYFFLNDFDLGVQSQENAGNDDHILSSLRNEAGFTIQSNQASFQFEDYRMHNILPAVNPLQKGVELESTENSECSRFLNHEFDGFLNGEVESDVQMTDTLDLSQEVKESHHVGSSSSAENNTNLSETTCCPSPVFLKSSFIKMPDCSQQINTCNITDDPKNTTLLTYENRNGETSSEYNKDSDINTYDQLEELRVLKRARIESNDEVKYLTSRIARDLQS